MIRNDQKCEPFREEKINGGDGDGNQPIESKGTKEQNRNPRATLNLYTYITHLLNHKREERETAQKFVMSYPHHTITIQ